MIFDPAWMSPVLSASAFVIGLYVSLSVSRLQTQIERSRRQDREEIQKWINGSFMRAAEVREATKEHVRRIENAERKIDNLHEYAHTNVHDLRSDIAAVKKFGCDQREEHLA